MANAMLTLSKKLKCIVCAIDSRSIFVFGFGLVILLHPNLAFAAGTMNDDDFGAICKAILEYTEGGFGALLASIAGLGAIVASAAGGFRMAWALLVVSIGAYILREYIEMFFSGSC